MKDIFNENVPLKTETPAFAKHVLPAVPSSEVYLEDCVKALKRFNDNHFDLAIVDPPYGIELKMYRPYIKKDRSKEYNERQKNNQKYSQKDWDNKPSNEYWEELFRVSKNQIIWGGNYFVDKLPMMTYFGFCIFEQNTARETIFVWKFYCLQCTICHIWSNC